MLAKNTTSGTDEQTNTGNETGPMGKRSFLLIGAALLAVGGMPARQARGAGGAPWTFEDDAGISPGISSSLPLSRRRRMVPATQTPPAPPTRRRGGSTPPAAPPP